LIVAALFGLAGNASAASSLYLTTSSPLAGVRYTSNDYYTFLAPYFAQVKTRVSISISKASNQSNQMGGQPSPTAKQASSPTISLATWDAGQAIFAINCDLSSVLTSKNTITVDGVNQNAFNRDYNVDKVESSTVKANQSWHHPQIQRQVKMVPLRALIVPLLQVLCLAAVLVCRLV
jgi:hypothetical protein